MSRQRGKWFREKGDRKAARDFAKEHGMCIWEVKHYGAANGKKKRPLEGVNFYCGHYLTEQIEAKMQAGRMVLKKLGSY